MRLQEFQYTVEYLPGPENAVADHLSRHRDDPGLSASALQCDYEHMLAEGSARVAGHLAYAAAGKALDVTAAGGDVLKPTHWLTPQLQ